MQNTTSGSQEHRCCQYQIEEAALESRWTLNSLQITKPAEAPNMPQSYRKNGGDMIQVGKRGCLWLQRALNAGTKWLVQQIHRDKFQGKKVLSFQTKTEYKALGAHFPLFV